MRLRSKMLESAMLTAALVSAMPFAVMAAPAQSDVTVVEEEGSHAAAGMALRISKVLQESEEEVSSIEKKEVETVTAAAVSEEEAAWQDRLMANVEDSMNVRTEASEEAALAGKLRKGDVAQILEQGDEWTKITSGNLTGFVKNEFCVFGQDAYNYAQENCTVNATVQEGGLRLRAEANEDSGIYDVAAQGDVLTVAKDTEAPEGWTAVQHGDKIAYVSSQYVQVELATGTGITVEEEQAIIAKQKAEEEAKKAEEARQAAVTQKEAVQTSYDETTILAAVIQLEAGSECYEGQVAVGAVIMNRVRSGAYPSSISGVVYQPGQFSVRDRIASVAAGGVRSSCMQAAQAALGGMDNTGGALSFAPVSSGRGGVVIGNHVFY